MNTFVAIIAIIAATAVIILALSLYVNAKSENQKTLKTLNDMRVQYAQLKTMMLAVQYVSDDATKDILNHLDKNVEPNID